MHPDREPWEDYTVGAISTRAGWTNNNCYPFETISHVTHIENAISILRGGKILPQLVYDHSILNQDRILVNWLSPNFWTPGFRYGNIRFEFEFQHLVEGKRFYWIESINEYNPAALRILITNQDRSSDPRLRPYNPAIRNGPWWQDLETGTHYRNGDYTLEFMLEDELFVNSAKKISVVDHHPVFCCIDAANCSDKGIYAIRAAGIFCAGVAIHNINCEHLPFTDETIGQFTQDVLGHFHESRAETFAELSLDEAGEEALARAWLSAAYFRRVKDQRIIRTLFLSPERFLNAVRRPLAASFGSARLSALGAD